MLEFPIVFLMKAVSPDQISNKLNENALFAGITNDWT